MSYDVWCFEDGTFLPLCSYINIQSTKLKKSYDCLISTKRSQQFEVNFLLHHVWWEIISKIRKSTWVFSREASVIWICNFHKTITLVSTKCKVGISTSFFIKNNSLLQDFIIFLTHLFPMHPFSTPWKYQKSSIVIPYAVRFSDVLMGQRKGALGTNGLKYDKIFHNKNKRISFIAKV